MLCVYKPKNNDIFGRGMPNNILKSKPCQEID